MRLFIIVTILFFSIGGRGQKPVTISYERFDKYNYTIFAENSLLYPFQLMLEFPTFENMVCDHDVPLVATVYPGKTELCKVYRDTLNKNSNFKWTYQYRMGAFPVNADTLMPFSLPVDYGRKTTFVAFENLGGEGRYVHSFSVEVGDTIRAIAEGLVAIANDTASVSQYQDKAAADNFILIHQPGNTFARYEVLKKGSALVKPGDRVKRGAPLALGGGENYDMGPHVKLTIYH